MVCFSVFPCSGLHASIHMHSVMLMVFYLVPILGGWLPYRYRSIICVTRDVTFVHVLDCTFRPDTRVAVPISRSPHAVC